MNILPLLDELQTIARNGLAYTTNPYDRERYEHLLELVSRYYGAALDLPPVRRAEQVQAELVRLSVRRDLGQISEDEYAAQEAALLEQLNALQAELRSDREDACGS